MMESETTEAPSLISLGAQAVVKGARRLGLTWRLQIGTVVTNNPLTVACDGDATAISMVSVCGFRQVGDRVYVLAVPPAGSYVIGSTSEPHIEAGTTPVMVTPAGTTFTQAVAFNDLFLTVPSVTINLASGAGETAQWHVRAINITTTGFTIFLFKTSGVAANAWASDNNMTWHAIE